MSQHCSPVLIVKKASGSYCLAVDFPMLNSIPEFDAKTINTITEGLHKFYGSTFFSELDITKAYCQILLPEKAMSLIAFPTDHGLMKIYKTTLWITYRMCNIHQTDAHCFDWFIWSIVLL